MNTTKHSVIIVGSGLAGLSAGLELQSAGFQVTILEANSYLGGRTASWNMDGMEVESGLHRVLGFYKEFPKLIRRAGLSVRDVVIWENDLEIKVAGGPRGVYGASPIFRPIKTFTSLFTNRLISWTDTWRLTKFFVWGLVKYFTDWEKLDSISVFELAKQFTISDQAIERVLGPLTAGIFFIPPERYSAYVFFGLAGQAVKRFWAIRVGAFAGGMSEVLANPIAEKIKSLGGQVLMGHPVSSLAVEEGLVRGIIIDGKMFQADFVILATGLGPAQEIVKNSNIEKSHFEKLLHLPTMPEINLQLLLTQPAWPIDRTVFGPGSHLITFAEQSRTTFKNTAGRLSIILTPPEKFIGKSKEEVFEIFKQDAPRLGIDTDHIIDYRVVPHPADFYLLSPGTEKLRPETKTFIKNLFLAGDYVKQPLLATMEGAIISGLNTAKEIKKVS